MRSSAALALAALVLALGACGGDDNGGTSGDASGTASTAPQESTGGSQSGGNSAGSRGNGQGAGGDDSTGATKTGTGSNDDVSKDLKLDDKSPAPKSGAKKGGGDEKLPSGPPQPARDFTGLERQIYESSRFFCHRAGVDGMREEYDIASDDPEDIAREAARRNYPRGFPEAVYSGCLTGLRD
jgi:hypothetical protein